MERRIKINPISNPIYAEPSLPYEEPAIREMPQMPDPFKTPVTPEPTTAPLQVPVAPIQAPVREPVAP